MLKRIALVLATALSLSSAASAKAHRGRPHEAKIFAARATSVALENEVADGMGTFRFYTQAEVDRAVDAGMLVPVQCAFVDKRLPFNRRYALPATVSFICSLNSEFLRQFNHSLMVDSAVRPATIQRRLLKWNRSAAPAYGNRASSHERGVTVDLSKKQTKAQHNWMIMRLLYYRAIGRVLVIEESKCWHIMVLSRDFVSVDAARQLQ